MRRDFTINALFLDPVGGDISDFTGGYEDLLERRLRLVGDPETRYREDPVRLLRAARFVAKLGVEADERTSALIPELAFLLADVPPARLFEEVCKLFLTGHAMRSFEALQRFGLSTAMFPALKPSGESGKIVADAGKASFWHLVCYRSSGVRPFLVGGKRSQVSSSQEVRSGLSEV